MSTRSVELALTPNRRWRKLLGSIPLPAHNVSVSGPRGYEPLHTAPLAVTSLTVHLVVDDLRRWEGMTQGLHTLLSSTTFRHVPKAGALPCSAFCMAVTCILPLLDLRCA